MAFWPTGVQEVHESPAEGTTSGGEGGSAGLGAVDLSALYPPGHELRKERREGAREAAEAICGIVADLLWQNKASDVLVARMANAFREMPGFASRDFIDRANGLTGAHP